MGCRASERGGAGWRPPEGVERDVDGLRQAETGVDHLRGAEWGIGRLIVGCERDTVVIKDGVL